MAFNCFALRRELSTKHTAAFCSYQRSPGSAVPMLIQCQEGWQPFQPVFASTALQGAGKSIPNTAHLNLRLLHQHCLITELEMRRVGGAVSAQQDRVAMDGKMHTDSHVASPQHRAFRRAQPSPLTTRTFAPAESMTCWGQKLCFVVYPQGGVAAEEEAFSATSARSRQQASETDMRK